METSRKVRVSYDAGGRRGAEDGGTNGGGGGHRHTAVDPDEPMQQQTRHVEGVGLLVKRPELTGGCAVGTGRPK
jgi:hypothetical protein